MIVAPTLTNYTGPKTDKAKGPNKCFEINPDLVPHRAYFDRRPQGSHSTATVVSISVLLEYRDKIVGCDVDGVIGNKTAVVDIVLSGFIAKYHPVTHVDVFVYCYDMDVVPESAVSVLYRKNGSVISVPAMADIVIPNFGAEEESVMVCAAGFGRVPYLDQWLTYQKEVGIKFIHINVNPEFLVNFNSSAVLQNFSNIGYVSVELWESYLNETQVFYHSQSLKYHDCVLRYQGKFKYIMVIDFDEYFVPFGNEKDVLSYAKTLIKGNVGSVILPRQNYYCMIKGGKEGPMPGDGNLTKLYSPTGSSHPYEGKSIHLTKAILQNSVHRAGELFSPYTILNYRDSPSEAHCRLAHLSTFPPPAKKYCKYN